MKCNPDLFSKSGTHSFIATFTAHTSFTGIYLANSALELVRVDHHDFHRSIIRDLSGSIPCLASAFRPIWNTDRSIVSQRLVIKGYVALDGRHLVAMADSIDSVQMEW